MPDPAIVVEAASAGLITSQDTRSSACRTPVRETPGGDVSIQSHNLSYGYTSRGRSPSFSLHDVTITIARGSLVGLLGPNGCGKTTLLNCCGRSAGRSRSMAAT
jgi:ATPase subunit of ABC transporter with duplicated ATPase domains